MFESICACPRSESIHDLRPSHPSESLQPLASSRHRGDTVILEDVRTYRTEYVRSRFLPRPRLLPCAEVGKKIRRLCLASSSPCLGQQKTKEVIRVIRSLELVNDS